MATLLLVESSLGNVETFEVTVREGKFPMLVLPQADLDLIAGKTYILTPATPQILGICNFRSMKTVPITLGITIAGMGKWGSVLD